MFIESESIVLKTIPFSETSIICRIFTKEKGKMSILAKGARRKKNPLISILEPGNLIKAQIIMKETREIQILKEASFTYNTSFIRNDLKRILISLSIVEIMDKTTQPMEEAPILFRLIYRVLQKLSLKDYHANILYWFYLIQLTIQHGFKPNLDNCSKCNAILDIGIFSNQIAELCCKNCISSQEIILDKNAIKFIKTLIITNIDNLSPLFNQSIDYKNIEAFLERFMYYHIIGMRQVKSSVIAHKMI